MKHPKRFSIVSRISPTSVLMSVLVSLTAITVSLGIHGLTPNFIVSSVDAVIVDLLPGWALTFGILQMGSSAQQISLALSGISVFLLYTTYAGFGLWLKDKINNTMVSVVIPIVGIWATESLLTREPAVAVYSAFAGGLVMFLGHVAATKYATEYAPQQVESPNRRRVLSSLVAAAVGIFWGVSTAQKSIFKTDLPTVNADAADAATQEVTQMNANSLDVSGLEPLVSESFYEVDISAVNPAMQIQDYTLTVTDESAGTSETYTYDDITSKPAETHPITLRCVGEVRNGAKMDTAVWTVVPLTEILDFDAYSDSCCVMLRAEDGYYEEFPLEALEDGYLAYGMNGELLPRKHGHPIRALIPGHWGEINVKWLTKIELLDEEVDGYWEEQGWHGTGPVNTVAKIHAINRESGGNIEVGGHAYAGTRGVSGVEVSIDGGETWTDAELSERTNGTDVWRQWVYRYTATEEHTITARAIEDDGTVQTDEETGPFPSGATGYVSRPVNPKS